jgi:hypothetical protein
VLFGSLEEFRLLIEGGAEQESALRLLKTLVPAYAQPEDGGFTPPAGLPGRRSLSCDS